MAKPVGYILNSRYLLELGNLHSFYFKTVLL
jgi:hypothetical protein